MLLFIDVTVTVTAALSSAVRSPAVDSWHVVHGTRRSARRATVNDVGVMFGGLKDASQQTRLSELASQDMVAAVLEYNEMVLATAASNGSEAATCWMRLNHNVTSSSGGLTDLFRDQVMYDNCCLTVFILGSYYMYLILSSF